MDDQNEARLAAIIASARAIRTHLSDTLRQANGDAHFRPRPDGVTLISLLDASPQIGHGPYEPAQLARSFPEAFEQYCRKAPKRRTPEKRLQSFLIADAYRHGRRLDALGAGELLFVTDELALLQPDGTKVVCDILAFRPDPMNPSQGVPVVIELKFARHMTRLIEQLTAYMENLWRYEQQFAALYAAVLGHDIQFTSKPERWLVWPAVGGVLATDPRAADLQAKGVRVVQYIEQPLFRFAASPV